MKTKLLFFFAATLILGSKSFAQVKFGDNPSTINGGSLLELETSNKGVLFPRVALTATTTWGLAGTATAGMVVYNNNASMTGTAAAPSLSGGVGFYYWDGSRWVGMSSGNGTGDFWRIKGNTGSTPPTATGAAVGTSNFWGTTDAQNLAVGTNGTVRAIFDQNGSLYGGTGTFDPAVAPLQSLVWGSGNKDSASYSFVTGLNNTIKSGGVFGAIFGNGNTVSDASYAFGTGINISGARSMGIGVNDTISGERALVSGNSNKVGGNDGIVGGTSNLVSGNTNLVVANLDTVSGTQNMVVGNLNVVSGNQNIVGGTGQKVLGSRSISTGNSNYVSTGNSIVVGYNSASIGSSVDGNPNFILGSADTINNGSHHNLLTGRFNKITNVTANTNNYNVVGGYNNHLLAANAVGGNAMFGFDQRDSASQNLVAGRGHVITSSGDYTAVVGLSNKASGAYAFGAGGSHDIRGNYSVAMGYTDTTIGSATIALGQANLVSGQFSGAIGYNNKMTTTSGNGAWALGRDNNVSGSKAVAIGASNTVTNDNAMALGTSAITTKTNQLVLGFTNGIVANGSLTMPIRVVSASTTLTDSDYVVKVVSGGINVTLPPAASCPGRIYEIKSRAASNFTVLPTGTDTIDSFASSTSTPRSNITVISDGVNEWLILF